MTPCQQFGCFLLLALVKSSAAIGLLDLFGFRPTTPAPPVFSQSSIGDFARQGLGLISYFSNIQRDFQSGRTQPGKASETSNLLGIKGLPNIPFLDGVPVVPGIAGSLPGVGACLPKGTPLINPASPSFLQDFLRNIPGAQDLLRSFQAFPALDPKRLVGKWHWVLLTPSVHKRSCATSDFNTLSQLNNTYASFGIMESFQELDGSPQISFGYGIKDKKKTSMYTQADPCPNEIVGAEPANGKGQYEYLVISNVAKFPVLGLARDLNSFNTQHRSGMEKFLKERGYTNFFTQALGSFSWADWSRCRSKQSYGNLVGNILNGVFFG